MPAGVLAAMVDVGFADVRSDLRSFAAQPDSRVNNANEVPTALAHPRLNIAIRQWL